MIQPDAPPPAPGLAERLRDSAHVVVARGEGRLQIAHALDARYAPLVPADLVAAVDRLADGIDVAGVDWIVGFPEGGLVPAFAFGLRTGLPVILATRLALERPGAVTFEEPHSSLGTTHRLYGLRPGDRVVIIEDEVTTGRTIVNAVRALRRAGVAVEDAGTLLALDAASMWEAMRAERIRLHVVARVPADRVPGLAGVPAR
jgi:adenine/guanine phosphoribosyltransferase-like PRPP-binding protein